jgi:amino acid adenylation domain-containing protein
MNQRLEAFSGDGPASSRRILSRSEPPALSSWLPGAASRWPDRIALEAEGRAWSYAQLWTEVSSLSQQLRQQGLRPGDRLGIAATRSADTIMAILAAVDAGLAYVPLDLSYPSARLRAMVDETLPRLVLGQAVALQELERLIGDFARLVRPSPPSQPAFASEPDLCYVLFTSGSTGRPKGVALGTRPLAHLIAFHAADPRLGQPARTLQFAPLSFDVHFQEIFSTIACGGTLVLLPEAVRRDPEQLHAAAARLSIERVFMPYVALQMLAEVATDAAPLALRDVISAGEQLQITPAIRRLFEQLPAARLHNHYGPTESHVVLVHELPAQVSEWPAIPPIGRPLAHVLLALRDEQGQCRADARTGELLLGGDCLAHGYFGSPTLTAERFLDGAPGLPGRWYVTGDLVSRDEAGGFVYLGRADQQLKVDGFRIEPGEIELALMAHPGVREAVVTAPELPGIGRQLVAHLVLREGADPSPLRRHLLERLPEHMVPVRYVAVETMPLTPSGKIDRKQLPMPSVDSPVETPGRPTDLPGTVRALWGELLGLDDLADDANLFDLGARSLMVLRFVARMKALGITGLAIADVYDRPTVQGIAAALNQQATLRRPAAGGQKGTAGVAIVGMALRTPGAAGLDAFWQQLLDGQEGIRHFSPAELDASVPASMRERPNFVAARGVLEDADRFDAAFFNIPAREATVLDPQQRLLLELSWNALEHAAIDPSKGDMRVGVYAGTANNSYITALRQEQPGLVQQYGEFATMLASEKDYVATRIAHRLNLNGPAVSVHTACSTGLVAVAQAWHALAAGQCDVALAGGATVVVPQEAGYLHVEGGMESADGHCRPFDAAASGTVFSSGGAVVVLKRLEDALADGDTIHAVIRGVGLNNDGGDKASFTAPSASGQAAAIRMALDHARVSARSIGYVEAHGTATALGDPIEVTALSRAWRADTADTEFCGLGSVKSNLGHMVAAAGVVGLIKATLALQREQIPRTIHFRQANPQLGLEKTPFRVVAENTPWPRGAQPRRAAVSSFGVGGTNAHLVIEEAPAAAAEPVVRLDAETSVFLLPLSARSPQALARRGAELARHLELHPDLPLAEVAATLMRGRVALPHRTSVVATRATDAAAALGRLPAAVQALKQPRTVFLFPGQGSQHAGMARGLYTQALAFREALDRCLAIVKSVGGVDLLPWLVEAVPGDTEANARLADTRHAQPALLSTSYALASWLESVGVRPDAMIGHSVGEYAAACLAGVMSLEDALAAVIARGEAMAQQPRGAMLAVRAGAEALRPLLPPGVEIAGCNAPALTVVSGPHEAIAALAVTLEAQGTGSSALTVSHAFHSAMMDGALPAVQAALGRAILQAPTACVYSCISGEPLTAAEATDPGYWARQVRATVQFSRAMGAELARADTVFVEVGPGQALTALLRQHPGITGTPARHVALLGSAQKPGDAAVHAVQALGQIWCHGVNVAWPVPRGARRTPLPTYPFAGERYWFERLAPVSPSPSALPATAVHPVTTVLSSSPMEPERVAPVSRLPRLQTELRRIFGDVTGLSADEFSPDQSLLDQGLDSLSLTQSTLEIESVFGIKLRFRRLLEDLDTVEKLANFLDGELPPDRLAPPAAPVAHVVAEVAIAAPALLQAMSLPGAMALAAAPAAGAPVDTNLLLQVLSQQMQLMSQHLTLLGAAPPVSTAVPLTVSAPALPRAAIAATPASPARASLASAPQLTPDASLVEKPFGASPRLTLKAQQDFTVAQQAWLDAFIARCDSRFGKSKAFSQQHRQRMADPRVVTGFNPLWKDLVYPLVVERSKGCRMWDLDGNESIDLLASFGANFLGYQPPDLVEAMVEQLHHGIELGPQHPLSAEVAELISEFTGMERVAFCNTGSEAVVGALRIARTVTGRKTVVIFTNSYHGIVDEVIVRGSKQLRPLPAAPGIPPSAVEHMLVLDYASEESLQVLRERAHELAAIMIEPIQNKVPTLQPRAFVQSLREICDEAGCALIFDECVTGFRVAPGGAQEFYGIRGDLACYGKIIGGGLPLSAIAGSARWMDALDGGDWRYGDASYPEAGVTYFAGTFVRHPLALAAAKASLLHIRRAGPALYRDINQRTQTLITRLNTAFAERGAPVKAVHCASLWRLAWDDGQKNVSLFYWLTRYHGLHLYEQFGHFVTEAMSDEDTGRIFEVFMAALDELMALGFITPRDGAPTPPPGTLPDTGRSGAKEGPLSPGQTERWLAGNFDPAARRALNESLCLCLSGDVDGPALEQALRDVLERHEAFRISFDTEQPLQHLNPPQPYYIAHVDLRHEADADQALDRFCRTANDRAFALDRAPLATVSVLRLADGRTVVHLVGSHLIFDGWASSVFNAELAQAYRARCTGNPPGLTEAASPLAFGADEQARFASPQGIEDLAFWKGLLTNPPPPLSLGDLTPGGPRQYGADTERAVIDGPVLAQLRQQAKSAGATLFQLLLTAVTMVLQRQSASNDFVVSVPFASQSLSRRSPLIGDGVLDLPLRLRCEPGDTAAVLLRRVRSDLMDALEHPLMTQGTVARALGLRSSGDRPPLTGVYFNLNPLVDLTAFKPLSATLHEGAKAGLLGELFFNFYEKPDALSFDLHHSTEYFSPSRARELVSALMAQCAALASSLDIGLAAPAPVATPAVDPRLLEWNQTDVPLDGQVRLEHWIEAQATRTPQSVAVVAPGARTDYQTLVTRARRYAQLLHGRGIGPGMRVGVCLNRSAELVPALLGVLKCGAAYVPLDPNFPRERLRFMAQDAELALVITQSEHADLSGLERVQQLRVDDDLTLIESASAAELTGLAPPPPDSPAYVIYTSGSTGKPKGVVVPQRAVCNFLASVRQTPGMVASDRLLAVTTLSFDIAVLELFLPLTCGARVVLAQRDDMVDGEALARLLESEGINLMQATPTTWHLLLDAGWQAPAGFRALCGGEALSASLAGRMLATDMELWNLYGPTETTVWSTLARVTDADAPIVIGRPMHNTRVWVLDEAGQPAAVGAEGELCIGGLGLANGYFKRPELTAERFIPDPFDPTPGARLYRTGDLGRWREDGTLEHLGRLDFQVKIRGYRIELGEIEACLEALPGVARSVVLPVEDAPGQHRLIGYVTPRPGSALDVSTMREALRGPLPDYMIPQQLVALEQLPLLPNGKIDRKSLPVPDAAAAHVRGGRAPRNALENQLAATMASVLKLQAVGIEDDFFSMGGHSLLAARLIGQINREHGLQLALRALFESPTVEGLAAAVQKARGGDAPPPRAPIVRRERQEAAPLTLMQERIHFVERMQPGRLSYHAPSGHRLRGPMNLDAFDRAFREVVRRQDAFRTAIVSEGDGFVQRVDGSLDLSLLPLTDLSALPEARRESALLDDMNRLTAQPFALDRAPLFQARLYRLDDDHHALFLMAHHIVWDGWSFDLFYAEMAAHYQAFVLGQPSPLPPLQVGYGDFAVWHRQWMQSDEIRRQTDFWKRQLGEARPRAAVHADKPRPKVSSGKAANEYLVLDASLVNDIQGLARQTGSTTSIVLLATYAALMSHWMDEPAPTIGMPVRGRPAPELESIMGFFNNTLPLRLHIDLSLSMTDTVRQVRQQLTHAIANQDVPFERISEELKLSAGAIYQALFNFQDVRGRQTRWGDLQHERIHVSLDGATEDMNLWLVEEDKGISGGFKYDPDLFLPDSIAALRHRFVRLLADGSRQPAQSLASLLAPSTTELKRLSDWEPQAPVAPASDITKQIGRGWQTHPDMAVLQMADRSWTGTQLVRELTLLETGIRSRNGDPQGPALQPTDDPFQQVLGLLASVQTGKPAPDGIGAECVSAWLDGLRSTVQARSSDTWLCFVDPGRPLFAGLLAAAGIAAGGRAVLVPWSQKDGTKDLGDLISASKATVVHAPEAAWDRWLASGKAEARGATAILDTAAATTPRVDRLIAAGLSVVTVFREAGRGLPLAAGALENGSDAGRLGRPLESGLLKLTDAHGHAVAPGIAGELRLRVPDGPDRWQTIGTQARWRSDGQLQHLAGFAGATFPLAQTPDLARVDLTATAPTGMTDTESDMHALWCELLGRTDIGLDDNFFDLGGYSLLAMGLVARIEVRLGKKIQPASLIEFPTVRGLSALLERSKGQSSLLRLRQGTGGPCVFFIHDIDGEVLLYRNLAMRLDPRHPVYALRPHGDDTLPILHTRLVDMADHYVKQIRAVQPEGPYILAGLCVGGELAFKVASRLQAQGQRIATLALIESAHASAVQRPHLAGKRRLDRLKRDLHPSEGQGSAMPRLTQSAFTLVSKTLSAVRFEVTSRTARARLDARMRKLRATLDAGRRPRPATVVPTVRQIISFAQRSARAKVRFEGDALLIRAKNGDGTLGDEPFIEQFVDPLFGWANGITGRVVVADVDGGHSTLLQEPYVASTHAVLQAYIDASLASMALSAHQPNAEAGRAATAPYPAAELTGVET